MAKNYRYVAISISSLEKATARNYISSLEKVMFEKSYSWKKL